MRLGSVNVCVCVDVFASRMQKIDAHASDEGERAVKLIASLSPGFLFLALGIEIHLQI